MRLAGENIIGTGIEDTLIAGNLLNPFSWFSGDNQKILNDADAGSVDNLNTSSLGGKLLDQRMQKEEAMRKLLGR